jgi:hypothetical protein
MAKVVEKFLDLGKGHIIETSFSGANNQSSAVDVTGFSYSNTDVRAFKALVAVEVDATADLYEVFDITGIQKASDWEIAVRGTGDNSEVDFTITSSGQIQYTSGNYTGFTSLTIKFESFGIAK